LDARIKARDREGVRKKEEKKDGGEAVDGINEQ
jgi:hypothetical protein